MARTNVGSRFKVLPFQTYERRRNLLAGVFVPFFQPLVQLQSGHTVAYEILARWQHPEVGVVLPDRFIPHAENHGWIGDLMRLLLAQALTGMQELRPDVSIAINVSPLQLLDKTLPRQIESAARNADFPLSSLTVEITETAFTEDRTRALQVARELKGMGCKLSLDDFGTGYSSLLHLQSLPFDQIKVDRSFVSSMLSRRESRKIVAAVVGLGQSLGIEVVAEGIENQDQVDMLLWLGCERGQGWLFGCPVPKEKLTAHLGDDKGARPLGVAPCSVFECSFASTPAERLAQLRALYDGAPVGLAFVDRNLRYRNINSRMADMNGAPTSAHIGRTVAEMLPVLFPHIEPYLRRALGGEELRDCEVTFIDPATGKPCTRWLSYQPACDEAGEVIGVAVAAIDVTNYKRSPKSQSAASSCERVLVPALPT